MTIEEEIDEKLKNKYTLIKSNTDTNIWVSKSKKIDYNTLYAMAIEIHKQQRKRVAN